MHIIIALNECVRCLKNSKNFGEDFVRLKRLFFKDYQKGYVFSTRFGADFFSLTLEHLLSNQPIVPEKGEKLGEYDKNFNEWMKIYC